MDGPVRLDKTGYTDFKTLPLPKVGFKISIIQFNHSVESSNTFFEYRGTIDTVTAGGVVFHPGTLFYSFVSMGDPVIPLKPYTELILRFDNYYTYMWAYIGGTSKEDAIDTSGGKSRRRKRKSRKSKLNRKRS